jgi:nucleoside-specific outer membrane channel protein Tsx
MSKVIKKILTIDLAESSMLAVSSCLVKAEQSDNNTASGKTSDYWVQALNDLARIKVDLIHQEVKLKIAEEKSLDEEMEVSL